MIFFENGWKAKMSIPKEKEYIREIRKVIPTLLSTTAFASAGISKSLPPLTSPICLLVSGNKIAVRTTAIAAITPAIMKGNDCPKPTVKAEIAGPKKKPKPKEAPIIPKPFALSFGWVVSEITAEATGILPAVIPSKARARNKKIALGAKAAIKKDTAVPVREIKSKGFLPNLSDIRPIIGVAIN